MASHLKHKREHPPGTIYAQAVVANEHGTKPKPIAPQPGDLVIIGKDGRPRTYKPTQMQLKAEYYRSQGMSKLAAARKAGYKLAQKSPAATMFSPMLAKYMQQHMQQALVKKGATPDKIADKMMGWLEAKKVHITKSGDQIESEDTLGQIKAYEKMNEIMHFSGDPQLPGGVTKKRTMTLEEWTFGNDEEGNPMTPDNAPKTVITQTTQEK